MDPFTVIERLWWAGVPVALVLGVLLTLNPLALPVLGTALGIGTAGSMADRNRAVQLAGAFGAGLLLVYTIVGVLAGQIDGLVESVFKPWAGWGYLFLGILLLGL
ncbi:MAG: hypothetical protein ACRDKS_11730, partial [Actinomycetota bacterium]